MRLLVLILMLVGLAAPAYAEPVPDMNGVYDVAWVNPTWVQPWLFKRRADGDIAIQLEAPDKAWGIRAAAKQVNQEVEGIHIYRYGTCETRPWAHCLRVKVYDFGRDDYGQWRGWTAHEPPYTESYGLIWLNTHYAPSRNVACHELGHSLGIPHHRQRGCLGEPRWGWNGGAFESFSKAEINALNDYY
jgi:hypothetical protein